MNLALLAAGVLVLAAATVDLLWTTLWSDEGAGPLSARVADGAWSGLKATGRDRHRLLSLSGPITLVCTLAMWLGLVWAGWTLVFASSDTAVVDTRNGGPVRWIQHAYFVGYTVFTLGNGSFVPSDGVWQLVTVLATASGMLFATLGVSYVLSVLSAVVDKRSFATTVTAIGRRGEDVLLTGWDGEDFHELDLLLDSLSSDLSRLAKQHKAYPILHYYHSQDQGDSAADAVAILDEALTLLRFGVPEDQRPNATLTATARASAEGYLRTLDSSFVESAEEPPPAPDLDRLREAGIPTVSDAAFDAALEDLSDRRRKLLGVVTDDARAWPGGDGGDREGDRGRDADDRDG